ncbi:MAG: LLM class flavin-dependent oxidoreductase [Rhizobiales bacterium]|nr:LLM class flavin-dependent oxidoreductase [Hyphomicrobiales bacterium]
MKFSLFVHMERLGPEQKHAELYQEFIDLCEMADKGGFHAIWTGEHHGMDFTIAPNPLINIADLARRTKNVRLGTGTVVAPFWHPLRLAGEAAMTDIICNGRLDLGIARGAYSFEYERMTTGMDAMAAGQSLREMVPALKGIWAGDYVMDGKFWKFPKSTSAPKPVQQPHPPLWVAARDPNSHDFAVANGCNVQVTPLHLGDGEADVLMGRFKDACKNHPEMPRPKIMLLMHGFVGADAADCRKAAEDLRRFYCYFGAWFKNERPISQALIEPLSDADMDAFPQYNAADMLKNTVTGTPDQVIKRLKAYEAMGYDEFSLWIDSGMTTERKKQSLQRMIDHVLPAFR